MKLIKNEIPVFFATDDNYAPYLAVAVQSMLKNANPDYYYSIYVLSTNLSAVNYDRLSSFNGVNCKLEFVDVAKKLEGLSEKLHLRDYYTKATYYRFFIPELFAQYDKALYLDCDIVVTGDIAELFNKDLGDNFVGGIPEEVMDQVEVFGSYVEKVLDVACENYFSAGILLMNLKELRDFEIEDRFIKLLGERKFTVTQDQDYLNVLCKDRVSYFGLEWNKAPIARDDFDDKDVKIIHYKINWKPWHYDDVLYEDYFWDYAKQTAYYADIVKIKNEYSAEDKLRDSQAYENLVQTAIIDMITSSGYHYQAPCHLKEVENGN